MSDEADSLPHRERIIRLSEELAKMIDYWVAEYDLTLSDVVGILEVEKHERINSILFDLDDEEPDDTEQTENQG